VPMSSEPMMMLGILEGFRPCDGKVLASEQALIAFVIPRLDKWRGEPR
jgi:hypothetical protein